MNTNIFLNAVRNKMRFSSRKGLVSVEDLFDLSLNELDAIAVALDEVVTKSGRKSFITNVSAKTTAATEQLEIVVEVIRIKQAEAAEAKDRAEKASRRQFLKNLKEQKELNEMEKLTIAEIDAQLAAIG